MEHRKNTPPPPETTMHTAAAAAVFEARNSALEFADIGIEAIEALPDARHPAAFIKIQDRAGQRIMSEVARSTRTLIGHQMQFVAAATAVMTGPGGRL